MFDKIMSIEIAQFKHVMGQLQNVPHHGESGQKKGNTYIHVPVCICQVHVHRIRK